MPVEPILHNDDNAPTAPGSLDEPHMVIPGPDTSPPAGVFHEPTCSDPVVHHLNETPPRDWSLPAKPTAADSEPPPFLLDRLNAGQRDSFYKYGTNCRRTSEKSLLISKVLVGTLT